MNTSTFSKKGLLLIALIAALAASPMGAFTQTAQKTDGQQKGKVEEASEGAKNELTTTQY